MRTKLDKDFIQEVNTTFKKADYIGKKAIVRILFIAMAVVFLTTIGGVAYKKWRVDKDREIYKQSVTYKETAASFLTDSFRQYNATEDEEKKKSIMQYVVLRYPNLDIDAIENETLSQFYRKCIHGGN